MEDSQRMHRNRDDMRVHCSKQRADETCFSPSDWYTSTVPLQPTPTSSRHERLRFSQQPGNHTTPVSPSLLAILDLISHVASTAVIHRISGPRYICIYPLDLALGCRTGLGRAEGPSVDSPNAPPFQQLAFENGVHLLESVSPPG